MANKLAVAPKSAFTTIDHIQNIVNKCFKEMTGIENLTATDTSSLVSMGKTLEELGKYDLFFNTLARRIGYTIYGYRLYQNPLRDFERTNIEWGAIVQKLTAEMPEAVKDDAPEVGQLDGQSLDQYIINVPKVHERFFDKESPYAMFITMQYLYIKEAFLSATSMEQFISMIWGMVKNKIEFTNEELARLAMVNYMANMPSTQVINLVTMYNNASGLTAITPKQALMDENFLRWASGIMDNYSAKMTTMSTLFNAEGFQRFTPQADQRFYVLSDYLTQVNTKVLYSAYNQQYVTVKQGRPVPYWQGVKEADKAFDFSTLSKVTVTINGTAKEVDNVIGFLFDRDAMGTFRKQEIVATTPMNARGLYFNTFWHERQLWFNDLSENAILFTLN